MSSIGTRASTAITKAFTNTMKAEFGGVDRFHKADMKSLAGVMKEIKNSPAAMGPFDRIDQRQANSLNQKIDMMIDTLTAQNSKMLPTKMAALTDLKTQLKAITSQSESKKTDVMSKSEIKDIKNSDLKSGLGNGEFRGIGVSGRVDSRRLDCN